MDFTQEVLNIVSPLTIVIPLLNILPPYLVFMLLSCIKRCIFSEDVAAKVVLIDHWSMRIYLLALVRSVLSKSQYALEFQELLFNYNIAIVLYVATNKDPYLGHVS
ncbi:hypothetical protein NC651_015309 [Populus alba x Populus x berolinensis]|nr:hypothetical protein NC651_015309 [Populus alba x Populus x berolinensis]